MTNEPCDLASERNRIADQLTDDEINLAIARNAVFAQTDSDFDKVAFALTALQPGIMNIPETKMYFFILLDKLVVNGEITHKIRNELRAISTTINSVDDLFVRIH
ncbi:MAG: hypothetical protein ACFFCQ_04625 [Promethearchaeota archaeon]